MVTFLSLEQISLFYLYPSKDFNPFFVSISMLNTLKALRALIFVIWATTYSILMRIGLKEKTQLEYFSLNFFH